MPEGRAQFLAVAAAAKLIILAFASPAEAAWSHPATPHAPPGSSQSVTTTTTGPPVKVPGKQQTTHGPAPSSFGDTITSGGPARVSIVSTTRATTTTTTTTVTKNPDGSVTTTVTTVTTAAGPSVVTTTLINPPETQKGQTVTQNPPTHKDGVTTTTITIVDIRPQRTVTETLSTVAVTPVAPVTTTTTTTTPAPPPPASSSTTPETTQPPLIVASGGDIEAAVAAASNHAEQGIEACQADTPPCIADALEAYAEALRKLAPFMPPQLRNLPDIVEKAAKRVRVAKTKKEALDAVRIAIAEVRNSISLLKADDPMTRAVGTREGTLVVETLRVANNRLEKAVGL
jgi:hypothetical protein